MSLRWRVMAFLVVLVLITALGALIPPRNRAHEDPIVDIEWSNNGKRLATADNKGIIKIWDVPSKMLLHTLTDEFRSPEFEHVQLAWNSEDSKLAYASDNIIKIWDLRTKEVTNVISDERGIHSLLWVPYTNAILFHAGMFKMMNLETTDVSIILDETNFMGCWWTVLCGGVYDIAWHPTDNILAIAGHKNAILDGSTFEVITNIDVSVGDNVKGSLHWNQEGTHLLIGHNIWDMEANDTLYLQPQIPAIIHGYDWFGSKILAMTTSSFFEFNVDDMDNPTQIIESWQLYDKTEGEWSRDVLMTTSAINVEGSKIAVGNSYGKIVVWNLRNDNIQFLPDLAKWVPLLGFLVLSFLLAIYLRFKPKRDPMVTGDLQYPKIAE